MQHYVPMAEYDVIATSIKLTSAKYDCCEHEYEDLRFKVELKRHPSYYINTAVTPSALLGVTAWCSFFMERTTAARSSARTAVVMTALLSQVTLRIVMTNKLPVSDQYTWMDIFSTGMLIFNVVALLEWVLVMWLVTCKFQKFHWEPAAQHAIVGPGWLKSPHESIYDDIRAEYEDVERAVATLVADEQGSQEQCYRDDEHDGPYARTTVPTLPDPVSPSVLHLQVNDMEGLGEAGYMQNRRDNCFLFSAPTPSLNTAQSDFGVGAGNGLNVLSKVSCCPTTTRRSVEFQMKITQRRQHFGIEPDGIGPQLAKKVDHAMRFVFFAVFTAFVVSMCMLGTFFN